LASREGGAAARRELLPALDLLRKLWQTWIVLRIVLWADPDKIS